MELCMHNAWWRCTMRWGCFFGARARYAHADKWRAMPTHALLAAEEARTALGAGARAALVLAVVLTVVVSTEVRQGAHAVVGQGLDLLGIVVDVDAAQLEFM